MRMDELLSQAKAAAESAAEAFSQVQGASRGSVGGTWVMDAGGQHPAFAQWK